MHIRSKAEAVNIRRFLSWLTQFSGDLEPRLRVLVRLRDRIHTDHPDLASSLVGESHSGGDEFCHSCSRNESDCTREQYERGLICLRYLIESSRKTEGIGYLLGRRSQS